ncbi:MAG: DUF2905 domain-containing protein [Candidatus Rokuibacteriota bacterium]
MGKPLIVFGVVLIVIGLILVVSGSLGGRVPFLGRLPGDLHVQRTHGSFYFPLTTSIILSVILTVVLSLLFRR